MNPRRIHVIDSHTAGEPTRVVMSGGPNLGSGPLAGRVERFRSEFDSFRSAVVNEPRGSDAMVGALLCEPVDPTCAAGVIFFNNVGYLGMCGHGTMGLVITLASQGRLERGVHRIETPPGVVEVQLISDHEVTVTNVPSYRFAANVSVEIPGTDPVTGDIAWGGNWFFLVKAHSLAIAFENVEVLTDFAWRIRQALSDRGITGAQGQEIDHIELFGPSLKEGVDSKNFVLCPGKAYDRSPCGTGTSAKMACLFADGKLKEGELWRQESIVGSVFEGRVRRSGEKVIPTITGTAFVNSESTLILDEADPFCWGIPK
ncbi:MAG: proline racemase family protein [Acidobacteriia bacterium]|nr:proline racemase family protein [Terriglobia bacterium]